jgi:repressor LexA
VLPPAGSPGFEYEFDIQSSDGSAIVIICGGSVTGDLSEVSAEAPEWTDADRVLTERQQEILQVITDFAEHRRYAPTLREIGRAVGLASTSSVSYQLTILQDKGYLRRDARRPRTVEVQVPGRPTVRLEVKGLAETVGMPAPDTANVPVPLIGQIRAGIRNLAEQATEETFVLPRQLVGDGPLFMLRVRGDSMINAAITDGDLVVVRQQPEAENGEIVAAMIDGEATVKTLQLADGEAWLMPHNPAYAPVSGKDATILGKVVTVLRRI